MTALFASGRIIDWILAGVILEGVSLVILNRQTGRGVAPAAFLPNLLSGLGVLLAMRLVIGGARWPFASAALLVALLFHMLDMARKWR